MVSFYNYNPERKGAGFADLYFLAVGAAFVLVFLLIASGYGIKFLIAFAIKYYLWVFGAIALIVVARHFWNKGNRREENRREEICEEYY